EPRIGEGFALQTRSEAGGVEVRPGALYRLRQHEEVLVDVDVEVGTRITVLGEETLRIARAVVTFVGRQPEHVGHLRPRDAVFIGRRTVGEVRRVSNENFGAELGAVEGVEWVRIRPAVEPAIGYEDDRRRVVLLDGGNRLLLGDARGVVEGPDPNIHAAGTQ